MKAAVQLYLEVLSSNVNAVILYARNAFTNPHPFLM